jgi:glutamate 5-kinase
MVKKFKRVVIKIGSSVLKGKSGVNRGIINRIAKEVATLIYEGKEVIIVSSGAILFGRHVLGMRETPLPLKEKQALAAIGQVFLMEAYKNAFKRHGIKVAQILLTHADFDELERWKSSRETIECLLSKKIIPVINENDTVATEEIKIGDNDHLSAMVALRIGAELLLILTNTPYVYKIEKIDGKRRKIPVYKVQSEKEIDELMKSAKGASSKESVGGMITKLKAAKMCMRAGLHMIISDGRKKGCISSLSGGEIEGTIFYPSEEVSSIKKFLISVKREKGDIVIDDGAMNAILKDKKSLLPVGVIDVRGKFPEKSVVRILSKDGKVIGKGRVNMNSEIIRMIKGKKTWEVKEILGDLPPEVIHSDYMIFYK